MPRNQIPTGLLLRAIKDVAPMACGVAIVDRDDRSTWRIDFKGEISQQDRDAAYAVLLAFPTDAPDRSEVNKERDRRIGSGFMFNGMLFQSRIEDQKRIAGAGTLAIIEIMNGAQPKDLRWRGGNSDFVWIAADNSLVPMDALTVIAFGQACATWEAVHVFAARSIKNTSPIPSDYAADKYWP